MLALARGIRAAAQLAESASSGERRNRFERIGRERTQEIVRLLKSAGLVYVRIDEWAETPDRTTFEEESLGSAGTREEVLTFLRTQIFPGSLFEEHLRDRLDDFFDPARGSDRSSLSQHLGLPVPLTVDMVSKALVSLAKGPGPHRRPATHPRPLLRRARQPLGAGACGGGSSCRRGPRAHPRPEPPSARSFTRGHPPCRRCRARTGNGARGAAIDTRTPWRGDRGMRHSPLPRPGRAAPAGGRTARRRR